MVNCPSCERDDFDTEKAMRIHHKLAHGESLAETTLVCEQCGDTFTVTTDRVDDARFCSMDCQADWQQDAQTGENNPAWKGGHVTLVCEQCDGEFDVKPARADSARFCSMDCHDAWREDAYSDGGHPLYNRVTLTCEICGDEFDVKPSHVENRVTCSHECRGLLRHQRGDGKRDKYYGPNWPKQAEKARERDGRACRICDMDEDEHLAAYGKKNPVHHIVKFDKFESYEQANRLDNLVTVCNVCHPTIEGWPVIPH